MKKLLFVIVVIGFFFANDIYAEAGGADALGEFAPFITKGIQGAGGSVMGVVTESLNVIWIPIGVVECTLGAPFGGFKTGFGHLWQGICGPFKAAGHAVSIPFKLLNVSLQ